VCGEVHSTRFAVALSQKAGASRIHQNRNPNLTYLMSSPFQLFPKTAPLNSIGMLTEWRLSDNHCFTPAGCNDVSGTAIGFGDRSWGEKSQIIAELMRYGEKF